MGFLWDEQNIKWFLDASAYTDFHQKLAKLISPYLSKDATVCDIGCGLGRLDLEIAPLVSSVTAIDIDAKVTAELERDAALLGFDNLHVRCTDVEKIDEVFDIVFMSFFGRSGFDIDNYYRLCRHKLIRVVSGGGRSGLHPKGRIIRNKDTVKIVQRELANKGRDYELITETIEFGQPLRLWQEAEQFILHHSPGIIYEEMRYFLHENAALTGRDDFPIYLPNPKKIGIFVIEGEE